MSKNKKKTSPEYEKAKKLSKELNDTYKDIMVLDKAIAEIQVDKAEAELDESCYASAMWKRIFRIAKKKKDNSFFAEPSSYNDDDCIMISEPELVMLRSFKQKRIDQLNDEISKLSAQINII